MFTAFQACRNRFYLFLLDTPFWKRSALVNICILLSIFGQYLSENICWKGVELNSCLIPYGDANIHTNQIVKHAQAPCKHPRQSATQPKCDHNIQLSHTKAKLKTLPMSDNVRPDQDHNQTITKLCPNCLQTTCWYFQLSPKRSVYDAWPTKPHTLKTSFREVDSTIAQASSKTEHRFDM